MVYEDFVKKQKELLERAKRLLNQSNYTGFCIIMDSLAELEENFTKEYVSKKLEN